jgi:hypothetical protein
MTPGGSGFFLLSYQGQRLALLSQDHTRSYTSPSPPGVLDLRFYVIENEPLWRDLIQGLRGPLIGRLQRALDAGDLGLTRRLRSPTGTTTSFSYNLTGVQLKELVDDPEQVRIGPACIGKTLRLSPHPVVSARTGWLQSPPAPVTPPVGEGIEVEVGRYALRSFDLGQGTLGSLFKRGHSWENGVAIAKCLADNPCAEPPTQDCKCGLYGTLTLDQLCIEYANRARYAVAVFAAQGRTFLGTKGLRTAAARVVAYWCESPRQKKVLSTCAPQATHFADITEMLAAYKFPEYTGSPYAFRRYRSQSEEQDRVDMLALYPSPPTGSSWANVAGLMTAGTPGGIAAVRDLVLPYPSAAMAPMAPVLRCGKCAQMISDCDCQTAGL